MRNRNNEVLSHSKVVQIERPLHFVIDSCLAQKIYGLVNFE